MSATVGVTPSAAAIAFDQVAAVYDEVFTDTAIGRAQRRQVWAKLLETFPMGNRILELNCGTGEDAGFLAARGRTVTACDASAVMIEVAKQRANKEGWSTAAQFHRIANEDLGQLSFEGPLDGAFSNFSGLNCVLELAPVAGNLARLVRAGGRVLLCVWGRVCVAEILWYLLQGQAKKAVRRLSGKSTATVGGTRIAVFYPTVRELQQAFSPWFQLVWRQAIGLFVPPTYVEQSIKDHPTVLARLEALDATFAQWPILRGAGDHVLLEFTRCR